jgi:uncharacterized protein (DUF2126 family)/transglutaminase-like putative cysteine protease
MTIHVALRHKTIYRYDRAVTLSPQIVRLRPAPHCRTPILSYSLKVRPEQHFINWQQDPQANYLARLAFPEKMRSLEIEVDLVAEMAVYNPFDFFLEEYAEAVPFVYEDWLARELRPYLEVEPAGPLVADLVASIDRSRTRTIDFLVALNQRLQQRIDYVIRMEPGIQTPEETLQSGRGSCRDSAWVMVQVLRHLGLAARFVSGYLIQLKPDLKALDGPSGTDHDFTDLHAWAEVYLPGGGWIGFDATSGLVAGEGHLPLACSPWPSSAAPITGAIEKCETEFSVEMTVTRIHETPRVTKPYSDEQWQGIDAVGRKVDEDLVAGDVRLTMGGEPTFVAIDDMDAPEWNTQAVGPTKRRLSVSLAKRMKQRMAPGGLIHFGQGKWYPGEPIPRWAINVIWRPDGVPVWRNDGLIGDDGATYGFTDGDAHAFISRLAERLDVAAEFVIPAYEDAWHYLWQERRLPENLDPIDNRLPEKERRERLAKVFELGIDRIAGYVLPLERRHKMRSSGSPWGSAGLWASSPWLLRRQHLFLLPGDSPLGLRLPLDSLPWAAKEDQETPVEPDPFESRPLLPAGRPSSLPLAIRGAGRPAPANPPKPQPVPQLMQGARTAASRGNGAKPPAANTVRTALAVEVRDGRLYVFLPPVAMIDDFLDLVAAVEDVAAELELPVFVEGYGAPRDPRVKTFSVTPDPGVIEVNILPVASWPEAVETTSVLYEEARLNRLGTEKFMLDGRHVGTGGGNHIVIGGATPADSPLLRRPDLLRSLVGYWNNHPSLSRLFSGLFIGPTSQAPRVDEARDDALYELEIAFQEIDRLPRDDSGETALWLIDRALRHLLVDVTGNTHRAEFCIDKLYSPEGPAGRLGLLELRAFEMPPDWRMSLAQQLLLRALIAKFWRQPYQERLIRWGGDLADRWLLPHWVAADLAEVLDDLRRAGYAFEDVWFYPHMEFRFPRYGSVSCNGVNLELRQALEPWHVLGEEASGGGTVRFVDASLERLQVKVSGLTGTRYALACNGRRVPVQSTGFPGEAVAGIRFRAWLPESALHPTIQPHAPLVFDVVDTWSGRSVGGCTYHVAHPGGRNYTTLPVNSYEAESRRLARFFPTGHTPGPLELLVETPNPAFPGTLDLRWQQGA